MIARLLAVLMFVPGQALAQSLATDQPVCDGPYSRIQFGAAIGQVTDALADQDLRDAQDRLNDIGDRLPCLDEIVDRRLFAKFARYMSIAYFYGQDEDGALRWGMAARISDPNLQWNETNFPVGHPLRELVDESPIPIVGRPSVGGAYLDVPKAGGMFMSGHLATTPEAYAEVPYLAQLFDRDQLKINAWWQDGSAFPPEMLTSKEQEILPPTWWTGDGPSSARARDPYAVGRTQKTPRTGGGGGSVPVAPLATSGALLAASAVTYFLASTTAATLPDQTTPDDLTAVRTRANLLVLASGVTLAGAVGVGVGGVVMHGNGITVRF